MGNDKDTKASRSAYFHFIESMDRVNRAVRDESNLEKMVRDVLDEVLEIFDCDRAFLIHPCDPNADSWISPIERIRSEYPGIHEEGIEMPMDSDFAEMLGLLLESKGAVKFGAGTAHPLPKKFADRFGSKSVMSVAIYPKIGKPWQFGIQQCSHDRVWTKEEERLLLEIGRRMEDGLTSLLFMRELQQSEAKYGRFVETSSDGICILDRDGLITFVNQKMSEMLGYSGSEMLGKPITSFMFEADIADHEQHFAARRQGGSENYERRFRHRSGDVVWTLISASPIFDNKDVFSGSFAVLTDITERKQAEKKLLANEQLFRALVENSPDFIARYDLEYRRIYVNPAIQSLFSIPIEDVLSQTPADQSPINTPQIYIDHLRQVIETAAECILETPFRNAQGETHWGQIRFVPEFDAEGNVSSVMTIGRDIHEIKESEQRLRRFIANLPAFFFTFRRTEDGRYCFPYASPGIETIYGLDPEDVRDDMAPLHMLVHPNDRRYVETSIARAFETLEPLNMEFRVYRPDMPERWVEARSIPNEEADGGILWYGIMLDITKRKRAEAELALSEEKFSKAFNASPNLMAITNPEDGRIVEINESFCRFFGYERDQCIGHSTTDLHMWVDPEQRKKAVRQLEDTGAALYMPVDLRTKSGEIRSVIDSMVFITLENKKRLLSVATDVTERTQAEERLRASLVDTIRAIALTVEMRDPYTAGHQNRVAKLCTAIGAELGLDEDHLEGLRLGAMIHDIGKVYVPAEILNRPGPLKALEYEMVKNHSQIGYEIVKDVKFPWPVAEMILQHHERLDGSGYPNGLKAPDILLESRIMAVADVVEAMLSHRPYRDAYDLDETLREIESHRGTKYDPEVVDACLHLFRDRGFVFS